jgi:hypothetical protein
MRFLKDEGGTPAIECGFMSGSQSEGKASLLHRSEGRDLGQKNCTA